MFSSSVLKKRDGALSRQGLGPTGQQPPINETRDVSVLRHHLMKPLKEISRVVRASGSLGVILHASSDGVTVP